ELDRIQGAAEDARSWARRVDVRFEAPSVAEVMETLDQAEEVGGASLRLAVFDYAQIFGTASSLEYQIATLAKRIMQRSGSRSVASLWIRQVSTDVLRRGREIYTKSGGKDVTGFLPGKGDTEWCKRAEKSSKALWSLWRPGAWRREMGED